MQWLGTNRHFCTQTKLPTIIKAGAGIDHYRGRVDFVGKARGNRVIFADDGLGISKENQERIFNSFFTTKEAGKGTGLGLSIYRSIVTRHGGRIYVESELGKGSNFIVELPFHR